MSLNTLLISKIAALALMFASALFFGLIPVKVRHFFLESSSVTDRSAKIGLSSSLCFGAGVLFATVFLHIFPETKEAFTALMANGNIQQTDYPIAELTFCSGFFFIYLMEEIAHWWTHDHPLGQMHSENDSNTHEIPLPPENNGNRRDRENCSVIDIGAAQQNAVTHCNTVAIVDKNSPVVEPDYESSNSQIPFLENDERTSVFRSILVVSALSLHGCFEGLAAGLEGSVFGVWSFCLAICLHKIVIAFSIGMELLEVGIRTRLYYIHMIGFSAAAPVGTLTGLILYGTLYANSESGMIVIAILQAISGGTILFVVFCEVLERERAKDDGRFYRFLALTSGFAAMACMQLVNQIEPDHPTPHSNDSYTVYTDTKIPVPSTMYQINP